MFWSIKEEMDWNKLWRYYSIVFVVLGARRHNLSASCDDLCHSSDLSRVVDMRKNLHVNMS
ncbi:rCG49984, isoform CRA_b [Rattus norvegicus]|uniref:RCG49984, isoform CRA_b n=2 Tax=Rattus norvegicus TaxID=10116 RepID=A6JV62_RAT|nr:rCG49984, isoform CRA_b [Rattus norvegicus]